MAWGSLHVRRDLRNLGRFALGLSAAGLLVTAAHSQSTPPQVGMSVSDTTTIGASILATVSENLRRRGRPDAIPQARQMIPQFTKWHNRFAGWEPNTWMDVINHLGRGGKWFPLKAFAGFPTPIPAGSCWGPFCRTEDGFLPSLDAGSGLFGIQECDELELDKTAQLDTVRIPSIPLVGSGPLNKGDPLYTDQANPRGLTMADSPYAAAIWSYHNSNQGLPEERWRAAWRIEGFRFDSSWPSYVDNVNGHVAVYQLHALETRSHPYPWFSAKNIPCPGEGGGSSDFHFYMYSKDRIGWEDLSECTWYALNFALGPTGYAYPKTVEVREDTVLQAFAANPQLATCPVSARLIQLLSDKFLAAISRETGWSGPPYAPVEAADVRVPGSVPRGASLLHRPIDSFPAAGAPLTDAPPVYAPPPSGYNPTRPTPAPPTGGGGNSDGVGEVGPPLDLSAPDVDEPDWSAPELRMPDWVPGFREFAISDNAQDCPIFGFDGFGQRFEMSSHCGFIEDNRGTLSTIMLVVFAFSAYSIILRA